MILYADIHARVYKCCVYTSFSINVVQVYKIHMLFIHLILLGYGDQHPTTSGGRALAVLVMYCGSIFIGRLCLIYAVLYALFTVYIYDL